MAKLQISVVSPTSTFYEGEADSIQIPVQDGLIGVLPGHAPLVSLLGVGLFSLKNDSSEEKFIVDGGFLEIRKNRVTVLANRAEQLADIDAAQARSDYDEALNISPRNELEYEEKMEKLASCRIRMKFGSSD